jgi:hypothetical protein
VAGAQAAAGSDQEGGHEGTIMDSPSTARSTLTTFYLQLAPGDIAFVKFLFESYEEIGIVRTVDRQAAVIVVLVAPDFAVSGRSVLDDIRRQIEFTEVRPLTTEADDWLMRDLGPDVP